MVTIHTTIMKRASEMLLAFAVFIAVAAGVACSSDEQAAPGPSAPTVAQTEQQEQVQPEPQVQIEDDDTKEFKIGDSKHVGIRLTILTEILMNGNPVNDPIGWAKAGAAAGVVDEICDDFDRPENTDAACDQLLIAVGTPFNQSAPVLAESLTLLREVVSRRDVHEAREWATWDEDIYGFVLPLEIRDALRSLRQPLQRIMTVESCVGLSGSHSAINGAQLILLRWRLEAFSGDNEALITASATEDLSEALTELQEADSGFSCSLEAGTALRRLDELGY